MNTMPRTTLRVVRPTPDALSITSYDLDGIHVLKLAGAVDLTAAGPFCDALVGAVRDGHTRLIADVSEVSYLSRSGGRGLVVAAKLLIAALGAMRISGASGTVLEMLRSLDYRHLLKCDANLSDSIAKITGPDRPRSLQVVDEPH